MEYTLPLSQVFVNVRENITYEYGYISLSSTEKTRTTWSARFPYLTHGILSGAESKPIFRSCV
jgi:hypothetical protein